MQTLGHAQAMIATLPASDMNRAKRWYQDKLGLQPVMEDEGGVLYEVQGSRFLVYPSSQAGTNRATAATLVVDDVAETADGLRQAGIRLEQYDLPNTEWHDGVATMQAGGREMHGIWFQDSEGNILGATDFAG